MLTRQQLKKSKGRTPDSFSLGELSALLDGDSNGQGLADFLLKKNGGATRPKRVFAEYKPVKLSLNIRTEPIKTPTEKKVTTPKKTPTTSIVQQQHCDVAKVQQATNEAATLQEQNIASPTLQPAIVPVPLCSPNERLLRARRSGGAMPSADRLRRFSLKRLSNFTSSRKLLNEFESTIRESTFLPPLSSTPTTHDINSKRLGDKPAQGVDSGATSTISSSGKIENTERMFYSLRCHDAALNNFLEHDSDKTNRVYEKENVGGNTANTPPPPSPHKQNNQRNRSTSPIFNQRSLPTTPVFNQRSRATTPVDNQRSRSTTPVSNQHSHFTTPFANQHNRPSTPVANQRSRPSTPVVNQLSRPSTPVANQRSRPFTPVANQHSRPTTPVSTIRRRTYTVVKGSQPGQVILTPSKSPPAQEQQPTSTVEDGILELPTSPVEEAVYALHTINLVTPDSPTSVSSLPVKPVIASPKALRLRQRYASSISPQPATAVKASFSKKSRIPLMTQAAKQKCKTANIEVHSTPENIVNLTRTHAFVPETQADSDEILETQDLTLDTQKILKTIQKKNSLTPMIVIPIHQTFNHTPTQSSEATTITGHKMTRKVPTNLNETTTTPINIEPDTTIYRLTSKIANKADDKSTTSTRRNESILITHTPEIIPNEDDLRLSDILTDDEEVNQLPKTSRRLVSSDDSQQECSNAPLNLASQSQLASHQSDSRSSSLARSRRLRKRSSTRRTQQKLSPLLSTETESDVGPPRAHPLTTRRTSLRHRCQIPLNAAPCTPINGERFAVEMKTHLARLNNREILDLRKRNSLGKVFSIPVGRKSSSGRKSSLSAKQALEQQLQLEEEIQMEILKRNLNGECESLPLRSPVLVSENSEKEHVYDNLCVETEQINEMPNEEAELLDTIPPAPADFRDITTRQSLAKSLLWQTKDYNQSSLVDDKSCDQVKFVSNDVSKKSTQDNSVKRRLRRNKKPVPEVLQKYMDVHNRKSKSKFHNQSKRDLYSMETELSHSGNSSFEKAKSPPVTSTAHVEQQEQQQLEKTLLLSTSKRLTDHPLPPPESFGDKLVAHTAVSTVAGTSFANEMDTNIFKKPSQPAPKAKKTKKTNRGLVKRMTPDVNVNSIQSNTTEQLHDETSSTVRRSKRSPKPLRNFWSFTSTDPTPLYDFAILEKRRQEAKQLREMRLQNSKASMLSMAGVSSTIPSASSTINSSKKRGRPKKTANILGDTDSSSSMSSAISEPSQKRLAMIQETESQSESSEKNLGDNILIRTDDREISSSCKQKVSQTPQRNNSQLFNNLTDDVNVNKMTKKKAPSQATENAKKINKPQTKKSTKSAPGAKKKAIEEAAVNQQAEHEATYEPMQHLEIVSHTPVLSTSVSHTSQRNNIPVFNNLANDLNVDKVAKKKAPSQATEKTKKINKPQMKKSTTSAPGAKKREIEEAAATQQAVHEVTYEPTQHLTIVSHTPVSRTSQQNNITVFNNLADDLNVDKVVKKKKPSQAKQNANKTNKPQTKKSTKAATGVKKKAIEEAAINQEEAEYEATYEPTQHIAVCSSTTAHINDIFDKLKSGMTAADKTPPTKASSSKCASTSKKSCHVRLPRLKVSNEFKPTTSNSTSLSKDSVSSSVRINEEDKDSNSAPSWLRDISLVGSKIHRKGSMDANKKMFQEMLCSQPGNLVLTVVDGVDYAYYENNRDIPFGFMRFQPNQAKRTKKARKFNLRFFVLSGKFKISTNKDIAYFSEGSVVTILKGSSYSITNATDKLAILMVFINEDN